MVRKTSSWSPVETQIGARRSLRHLVGAASLVALATAFFGCPESGTTTGPRVPTASGPCDSVCRKWVKRASDELRSGELTEADDSIKKAQGLSSDDPEAKLVAGRIALARLDWVGAVKALSGLPTSESAGLRARAYWYADDLQHTAEELSHALEDPDYKDPWAKPVRELAGSGNGRRPFELTEQSARLIEVKMPRDLGYALMIPCEIDGTATVALAVTGVPEVILDSKGRSNPGWVTFKFTSQNGERSMEFRDVPAMVQDLSAYTQSQTVPVGALIGMNFLRRMHVTIDRRADQFILRKEEPPTPPSLTKLPVSYVRGGGMVVRATMRQGFELTTGLWVDTGSTYALTLPDPTWAKLGVDPKSLPMVSGHLRGRLSDVHLGGLDLGAVDASAGELGLDEKLKQMEELDVAGAMGGGFLAAMRVTMVDGGRTLWLETDPDTTNVLAPDATAASFGGSVAPIPPPAASGSTAASATAAPSAKPSATTPVVAPATSASTPAK